MHHHAAGVAQCYQTLSFTRLESEQHYMFPTTVGAAACLAISSSYHTITYSMLLSDCYSNVEYITDMDTYISSLAREVG